MGQDEAFLAGWKQGEAIKAIIEWQPGYLSTALHRSLDLAAQFRSINVATWESAQDFSAALNSLPECGALDPLPVRLRGHRDLTQRESREQAAVKVREMDQYPDPSSHCRCRSDHSVCGV